jgi:biopolymer transport protein ExbB
VPAVLGYNILLRRNKIIIEKLKYFATDMHAYLLSGARVGASDMKGTSARAVGGAQPAAAR